MTELYDWDNRWTLPEDTHRALTDRLSVDWIASKLSTVDTRPEHLTSGEKIPFICFFANPNVTASMLVNAINALTKNSDRMSAVSDLTYALHVSKRVWDEHDLNTLVDCVVSVRSAFHEPTQLWFRHSLSPSFIERNKEHLDWTVLCSKQLMPLSLIESCFDKGKWLVYLTSHGKRVTKDALVYIFDNLPTILDYKYYGSHHQINEAFVLKRMARINVSEFVRTKRNLTESFLLTAVQSGRTTWSDIVKYQTLSEVFIEEHDVLSKIGSESGTVDVMFEKQTLSEAYIRKHAAEIPARTWDGPISRFQKLSAATIKEYVALVDLNELLKNKTLDREAISEVETLLSVQQTLEEL